MSISAKRVDSPDAKSIGGPHLDSLRAFAARFDGDALVNDGLQVSLTVRTYHAFDSAVRPCRVGGLVHFVMRAHREQQNHLGPVMLYKLERTLRS